MALQLLTKKQSTLLKAIGGSKAIADSFYLTGGTALAGFYLFHRYSEDLDFFSEREFDPLAITSWFHTLKQTLSIATVDYRQSFNRNLYFLTFSDGETVKTEFTYFPFTPVEKRIKSDYGVSLDSMRDIAVNKLFSVYQRSVARDYIDLFFLVRQKGMNLSELIKQARIKFDTPIDPLQLGTQFAKAADVRDYPRMVEPLDHATWRQFFEGEAKKLKPDILR